MRIIQRIDRMFWLLLLLVFLGRNLMGISSIPAYNICDADKQTAGCVKPTGNLVSVAEDRPMNEIIDKNIRNNNFVKEDEGLPKISYSFPETVVTGQIFNFVFEISKVAEHSIGGKFHFTWPMGFQPMISDNPNVVCRVEKNIMIIEWKAQAFTDDIKVAYPVQVNSAVSGVYPILAKLTYIGGLQLEHNAKIRIDTGKSGILPDHTLNATTGKYSIILQYQREIEKGGAFNLDILINKGSTTTKGFLNLTIPPNSDVQVINHDLFEYEKQIGKLKLIWHEMPETNPVKVTCSITCNTPSKAVYPMMAELFVDEKMKAFYSNSLYLTPKLSTIALGRNEKQAKKEIAEKKADSLLLFAEMDELLNQWKNATKIVTIETGKANQAEAIVTNVTTQKSDTQTTKKPEPAILKPEESRQTIANQDNKTAEEILTPVAMPAANNDENIQNQQAKTDIATNANTHADDIKTYRVQVAASKTPLPGTKQFLHSLGFYEIIIEDYDGIWYRYFVGEFSQISDAKDFNRALMEKGINDSFVVTFIDGKRVIQ